jgi:hypothetical protein
MKYKSLQTTVGKAKTWKNKTDSSRPEPKSFFILQLPRQFGFSHWVMAK